MNIGNKINRIFIIACLLESALGKILDLPMTSLRFLLMLAAIAVNFSNPNFRKALVKGAVGIWGLWAVYSVINWYICPKGALEYRDYVYVGSFVRTYAFLAVLYYEASLDYQRTLKMLLYIFVFYFFLGLFGQGNGPVKESASWEGRSGTLLGNHFPLAMICGLYVAFIARVKEIITPRQLYIIIACVTGVVLWVATRKAMYGIFILCLFYVLSNIDLHKKNNILYLIFGTGAIYAVYQLVMKYTLLGARVNQLSDFEYSIDVPSYLQFLGDRAIQYVLAWEVFIEHPINGVGLGNSMDYTGLSIPLHTEYMEHLCEGGFIGTSLFIIFIYRIAKGIYINYKYIEKSVATMMAGGLAMLLFLSLSAWLYNQPQFFVVYAMIIAYCNPINEQTNLN